MVIAGGQGVREDMTYQVGMWGSKPGAGILMLELLTHVNELLPERECPGWVTIPRASTSCPRRVGASRTTCVSRLNQLVIIISRAVTYREGLSPGCFFAMFSYTPLGGFTYEDSMV